MAGGADYFLVTCSQRQLVCVLTCKIKYSWHKIRWHPLKKNIQHQVPHQYLMFRTAPEAIPFSLVTTFKKCETFVFPTDGYIDEKISKKMFVFAKNNISRDLYMPERPLGQDWADGQLVGDQLGEEDVSAGRPLEPPYVRVLLIRPVLLLLLL